MDGLEQLEELFVTRLFRKNILEISFRGIMEIILKNFII